MSEAISSRISELTRSARMLAIIGAALRLRSATGVDPALRAQVASGLRLVLGDAAADLDEVDSAPLLTMIDMALTESGELFKNPARGAGWQVDDRELLQAMGRASSHAFDRIRALAQTRPSLQAALDGVFLDVGTGVGGIAIRAVETCPDLEVDAIDIWAPALRIAAENIAASRHAARIRLRHLDVSLLEPGARYTLAWLPSMFLKRHIVDIALDRIAAATHSGGWLVVPLYTTPADPFMAVMASLRTLRSGGELTDPAELASLMRARGYADIEIDVAPVASFVIGRRP